MIEEDYQSTKETFNSRWAKIPVTASYRWKPEHWKLHVATPLMASKSKVSTPTSQPDISNYIQRQRTNSNKRLLSSPTDNQPNKKAIMEVTTEVKDSHGADKPINLPPTSNCYTTARVCIWIVLTGKYTPTYLHELNVWKQNN